MPSYYSVLLLLLLLLEFMLNEGGIKAFLPPHPIKPRNPVLLSRGLWETQTTVSSTTAAAFNRAMMIDGGLRAACEDEGLSVNSNTNDDIPPEMMNDVASIERLSVDELDEALHKMGIDLQGHSRAKKVITIVQALGLGNKSKSITLPHRHLLLDDDNEEAKILAQELEPCQETVPVATGDGISDHRHFAPPRGLTSMDKEHTEAILSTGSEAVLRGSSSTSSELDERLARKRTTVDVLLRQEVKFTTADSSEVDAYIVSTKRAAREWEGEFKERDETHVVIVMSDSFGYKDPNTRAVADEVAFICNTVVVVPDLFRGQPWIGSSSSRDHHSADYESWRVNCANEDQAISDAASCALYMKAEYQPASVGFFGMSYGGGRALELAAIAAKEGNELLPCGSSDKNQKNTQLKCTTTHPATNRNSPKSLFAKATPDCVVAFYPTCFDPKLVSTLVACPVMAIFAGNDKLPGARPEDATMLQQGLEANPQVLDYLLRSFEGEENGFAHRGVAIGNNKARDATTMADDTMLLATMWFDLYLQKKNKTTGMPARMGLESSLGTSS